MSAFAPLTLATATFTPSSIDSQGVARFFAAGAGGFDTRKALSLRVTLPKSGGSVARVTVKAVIPVMNLVTEEKTGDCIATAEFVLPKTATPTDRLDLITLLQEMLLDDATIKAVQDLESIY